MKIKILIILLFISTISFASGFKTFVPKGNEYVAVEIKLEKVTMTSICNYLGYNSDQFYVFNNYDITDSKIDYIIFKVFTDDIICVLTEDTVDSITQKDVDKYLVNFNLKEDFGSYDIESTLEDGVKNKSLTKKFLSKIFNQPISSNDNSFIAEKIDYELHFKNGILSNYNTSDGLNKWAKDWKNTMPDRYKKYYLSASLYYDNKTDIINVINIQADASVHLTLDDLENIKFHTNNDGTINYKMLLIAQNFGKHFGGSYKINLQEFKFINKGRYKLSNEFNTQDGYKRTTYRVNKGLYTFDENGKLVNTYISN